jgi:hypothetical protein
MVTIPTILPTDTYLFVILLTVSTIEVAVEISLSGILY